MVGTVPPIQTPLRRRTIRLAISMRARFPLATQFSPTLHSDLLSRVQAAHYLGVSPRTLAVWKSTGRYCLPVCKIGRLAKYRRSDLDAFIAKNLVGPETA